MAVGERRPNTCVNFLIETDFSFRVPWHFEIILSFFSWWNDTLVSLVFVSTPRNCKIWQECNRFFSWSKTPKFQKKYRSVPRLNLVPFLLMLLSKYRLEILSVSYSISAWPKLGSSLVLWITFNLYLDQNKGFDKLIKIPVPFESDIFLGAWMKGYCKISVF